MKSTNKSTIFILVGAILAGGAGWFLTQNYIDQQRVTIEKSFEEERQTVEVVVSAADLEVGDLISPQTAQVRSIPRTYVPKDAVFPENYAAELDGRQIKYSVKKGEPLLKIHVSNVKIEGLASLLGPGQRAITIPVDTLNSLSGFLRPGNNIDLYVTVKDGERERTAPLVQNLRVLATGEKIDDGLLWKKDLKYKEVTLAVTPLQATKVIHANKKGDLSVVLRKSDDKATDFDDYVTIDNLLDTKQTPPTPPPPPPPPMKKAVNGFELIRGGKSS